MNDQLEPLLRDTFDRVARDAPTAVDLAAGARARLRQRHRSFAGTVAVAAAVVTVGAVLWGAPRSSAPTAPAATGGVTVSPSPAPVATSEYCVSGTGCPEERAIEALRRPLHLPTVAAGAACPVSAPHTVPQGGGFSGPFTAVGDGPFRLTGSSRVQFEYPPPADSGYEGTGWGGQKVIWSIDATYSGPVLLRGARIDGEGGLRFDHYLGALGGGGGGTAYPELAYGDAGGTRIVRTYPSAVRLQEPGCYAIQVDGTTFSEIIVFRAELGRP